MKNTHYEWAKSEGMTDEEIAKDWEAFEADYEEWEEGKRKAS